MTICDNVQRQLAEAGIEAAEADEIARHLAEGCDDCTKFLTDLRTIDAGLVELTSHDAPDALVADTLAAVRAAGEPKAVPVRPSHRQRWLAGGLASGAVIAASVVLTLNVFDPSQFSTSVADKISSREAIVAADNDGGGFSSSTGSQGAAAPALRDAEQALSESENLPASSPVGNLQARTQKNADVGDFRSRGDNQGTLSRIRIDEIAQAKRAISEEGAAELRELDVIAQVAPEDLARRRDGRAEFERQAGAAGSREVFENRSESSRDDAPSAPPPPVASTPPVPAAPKAKFDDDSVRFGAAPESQPERLRMPPEAEPPRSSVVGGKASRDLSELNKEVPAKDAGADDAFNQRDRFNSVVGAGSAANEITRGKPAEQSVSSAAPVEAGEDEKKNRANIGDEERTQSSSMDLNIQVAPSSGPLRIQRIREYVEQHLDQNQSGLTTGQIRKLVQNELGNTKSESERAEIRAILEQIDESRGSLDANGVYLGDQSGLSNSPRPQTELAIDQLTPADRFLMAQRSLDDLIFQEPTGYWANTYIPGDPEIRVLQARLAAWDRSVLGQYNRLEQDVRPGLQPFDAPADAAVAVTLAADTTSVNGPTRMRVQIGVKGAERLGGRRPAMNIGLVVDLRSLTNAETGSRIRALISSLERARQPGDRFSLTVAGPAGGLLVTPEQFRHGPLQVALDRMFNSPGIAGEALSLPAAMGLATENVRAGDNPESVLGSSLVMLVTGSSLEGDVDALERVAHQNAVGGVPLSVVGLAGQDNLAHIDRLVAAGQGNRRILDAAQAAEGLVDRELHAASRAVARALRLRIRLAPGVKLVSVLDSRKLGEPQAAQVREAEVAIDQRLARNLGIEADRGDDEQGIQMVIPNFFAGDSHVVLLDVVADQAGPVADVTVRYKDVINLKNGVAQASLALDDTPRAIGPLERNVLKNLIAVEFAKQTRLASRELAQGDFNAAQVRISELTEFARTIRFAVPGWQNDADLAADERVLNSYTGLLTLGLANDPAQRQLLADSLRVAAHRKLQPDVPR